MPLGDSVPWSGLPRHNARAIAEATGPFPASSCDPPPSRAEAIRTFHLRAGITERGRHTRERQNWPGPETWSLRSAFLWFWAVENLKSNEPESEGQSGPSSTVDRVACWHTFSGTARLAPGPWHVPWGNGQSL